MQVCSSQALFALQLLSFSSYITDSFLPANDGLSSFHTMRLIYRVNIGLSTYYLMAKPIKTLELHYPMIQFLINIYIFSEILRQEQLL